MVTGADDRDRTGDLVLTKDVLCQLSYIGSIDRLERETGIEPATNSLEGCDSTTELLPPNSGRTAPLASRPTLLVAVGPEELTPAFVSRWWGGEGSNLRSL